MEGDPPIPSREDYLGATFGETGYLSKLFPGYRPRPGQVALAQAVDRAIATRTHLFAEGGTGIGKSFAYSVPASYYAWLTGHPVVIVTANIALQEQIVHKDLPLLQKVVPWPFTYALLKGRNHYLCEDKRLEVEGSAWLEREHRLNPEDRVHFDLVRDWAADCANAGLDHETGDVSDLPFQPSPAVWGQFSVSGEECKKDACLYREQCFATAAMKRAHQAQVVVTNYAMLFVHLQLAASTGMDLVLPPFEVCILDEAHKAADIARDFFGFRFTQNSVRRLTKRVAREAPDTADSVDRATTLYFHTMAGLLHDRHRYKGRIPDRLSTEEVSAWEALALGLSQIRDIFRHRTNRAHQAFTEAMGDESREDARDREGAARRDLERCETVLLGLTAAMGGSSTVGCAAEVPGTPRPQVYFLEENEKRNLLVGSKLVHPGDILRSALYQRTIRRVTGELIPTSVIATSATLATSGDRFDFVAGELGAPAFETLLAPSPFDWPNQCLFIVPADMPDPQNEEFKDAVARTVEKTVLLAGGRTLALFTSNRVLNHTYDVLIGSCQRNHIRLLKQGDAPRTKLVETFKSDVTSVLLGTESFWAGVDVPGEACSVVVMDRLPFPTPDDPVLSVLSEQDDKWFFKHAIPRAIIQFKQGFGRLVRSSQCRGVVVCLDQRLSTKRYGREFLRALPDVPKTTRLEALVDWLRPRPPEEVDVWAR
jgi:ATP-dependent DNA helicase DinG